MRVFWSERPGRSITTLALVLLFWPLIGARSADAERFRQEDSLGKKLMSGEIIL